MATTTTNFGWDIPQSTDLVKDGATAIAALGQDIDTAMVDLKGGTTGQVLAKASGTDLDFSWVAQDDSNAIQNAIVDAKGDLIAATAADTPARLAVGTNGQVLTADSTAATGLAWATAASAGGYTLINTGGTALTGTATGVTTIPSTYKDLVIYIVDYYPSTPADLTWYLNNDDTGGNYQGAGFRSGVTAISFDTAARDLIGNQTDNASNENSSMLYIPNYANTVAYKNITAMSFGKANGSPDAQQISWYVTGYKSTSAVSSFYLKTSAGTFSGGTIFVYGVK